MASILQSHDVVHSLADSVQNLKISTLLNAAKISPLVLERTIGPKTINDLNPNKNDQKTEVIDNRCDRPSLSYNNNGSTKTGLTNGIKFRKDVWREVNIESEHEETSKNIIHLSDCKVISFRLRTNAAEKQRRAKISSELQEKQCQWDSELEQRLQQIRIDSAEKQKKNTAKRLEREKLALEAIEKIEAQAEQDELRSNMKKNEMIEHSRKLIEHANQLKRQDEIRFLLENINANKVLFINLFELFAKTIINQQELLNEAGKLEDYTSKRDILLQRYEQIINSVNTKPIIASVSELFDKLCADIKKEQSDLNSLIVSCKETLRQNAATTNLQGKIEPSTNNQADALRVSNAYEISTTDGNKNKPSIPTIESSSSIGSRNRIAQYNDLMDFYQEYKDHVQPLIVDVSMKKFRFNCQKAVNTPVNSIASVSVQHLQDKFEKISDLLLGNQVRTGDIQFTASEHPLGIKFCTFLLAKKFITQGTTVTSTHHQAAFPIAAVIVSVWQLFPDMGKLFLALLYIECPFFVPYFVPPKPGQSKNDYYSLLGYKFNDGKREEQEQYLYRISGLQRLYSAVLITKLKRSQQHMEHPHGIENGWIWLSNFLMLDTLPGISPTLLLGFIQICGADMYLVYKKQLMKLLLLIYNQYIPELEKIDTGAPFSRLKDLISAIVKENKITPPIGTLQKNFW